MCVYGVFFSFFCFVFFFLPENIFHLDVHYVCYIYTIVTMLVQCFELQGRRFTHFHYFVVVGRFELIIFVSHDIFKHEGLCILNYEAELYLIG